MKKKIIISIVIIAIALVIGFVFINRANNEKGDTPNRLDVSEYSGEQSGRKVKEMLGILSNNARESDEITIYCEFYGHSFLMTKRGNKIDPDSPYKDRLKSIEVLIEDDLMYYINVYDANKEDRSISIEIYDGEKADKTIESK